MKTLICIVASIFMLGLKIQGEIIITQGKDGKIIISNSDEKTRPKRRKRRRVKISKSGSKVKAPQKYMAKIKTLSIKYDLREDLIVAVAKAESSFNPMAKSHKGAVGIMQLMPQTAKIYGVTNRYNVDQNLQAGVRHLRYLYHKYNKNLPLTLAAYNAGENAVKKYRGVPPYQETRNYIRKVMHFMGLSYSGYFSGKANQTIYKYYTKDGKIIITDTLPNRVKGRVEVID